MKRQEKRGGMWVMGNDVSLVSVNTVCVRAAAVSTQHAKYSVDNVVKSVPSVRPHKPMQ